MRDLITLIDTICDVYDNPDFQPKGEVTFCNIAVGVVAEALGCKDLTGKNANDIMAFLQANENWSSVAMEKVQDLANQGSLVIAGLCAEDLGQAHGHVTVVRPGHPCFSGKWNGKVPRVLNIGAENFLARSKRGPLIGLPAGVNEAFLPLPKFYVWRSSL